MAKRKINYDLTYNNNQYEMFFYQDLNSCMHFERLQEIQKFISKVKKSKELLANQVILGILQSENIQVDNSSKGAIESALKCLKYKITILPMKATFGSMTIYTNGIGSDYYLTSDNYICYGEKIWLQDK